MGLNRPICGAELFAVLAAGGSSPLPDAWRKLNSLRDCRREDHDSRCGRRCADRGLADLLRDDRQGETWMAPVTAQVVTLRGGLIASPGPREQFAISCGP